MNDFTKKNCDRKKLLFELRGVACGVEIWNAPREIFGPANLFRHFCPTLRLVYYLNSSFYVSI